MAQQSPDDSSLVISYLTLRKILGILGIALPFVVSIGAWLVFHTGIQSSISSYYYSGMRDVLVGTLCAIGFFLLSYKGYERADDIAGDLGCISAIGLALFPTTPGIQAANQALLVGHLHTVFTVLFFITLIFFSYYLFTKTNQHPPLPRRKLQRNRVYRGCAYAMGICLLAIVLYRLLPSDMVSGLETYAPVYWLETMAIVAFGFSWLTKGEALLKDEVPVQQ